MKNIPEFYYVRIPKYVFKYHTIIVMNAMPPYDDCFLK